MCIDVLSKYAVVVPIKGKDTVDVVTATMEALQKMKAKPKMIYTDDEKAIASSDFKQYVEDEGIELYRTRGHPAFAERFIRTFKDKLFKRVEADEKKGKQNIDWTDYILEIMLTYNDKDVHSSTGQTPNEARKKKNEYKSVLNVSVKAKKEKMYPELKVGDKVKIIRKKAITEKERTSHFLKGEYVVEEITTKLKQKYYKLTDYPRPLMRHDLMKVWLFFEFNIYVKFTFHWLNAFFYGRLVPQQILWPCTCCCWIIPVLIRFVSCDVILFSFLILMQGEVWVSRSTKWNFFTFNVSIIFLFRVAWFFQYNFSHINII